jgi:hypothetical protein
MGYKGKSNKEYQREYYYKNREQQLLKMRQYNKKGMILYKNIKDSTI